MDQEPDQAYDGFWHAGARLREETLPTLQTHRTGRLGPVLFAVHRFDKAHVVMLTEEGLIPREDGIAILRSFREMEREGVERARFESEGGKHSGETYLIRRLGKEVGGRIHLGRSSADLAAVGRRMVIRDDLISVVREIGLLRRAIAVRAREHVETVMPGYTHGQHAQPTTFAHWLAMWLCVFERDAERMLQLLARVNRSPAGAAVLTGSEFPLNRSRVANLLGFADILPNTMDAVHSHDAELETFSTVMVHAANLARLSEDVMTWCAAEYGLLELPDRFCGTSSILAQKKNPHLPQAIRGIAASAVGGLMAATYIDKDPTGQAILERHGADETLWGLFASLCGQLPVVRDMMESVEVHRERMFELSGAFWGQATDVAGALVREEGLAWRIAHQIVGALVRISLERRVVPTALTPDVVDEAAIEVLGRPVHLPADALREAVDPRAFVRRRKLPGGPAPEAVLAALASLEVRMESDEAALATVLSQVREGDRLLEEAVDQLLSP